MFTKDGKVHLEVGRDIDEATYRKIQKAAYRLGVTPDEWLEIVFKRWIEMFDDIECTNEELKRD